MTKKDELRPWAIFQHPPDEEKAVCVCRFRTRTDADAYMSILRRGGGKFEVLFDQVEERKELSGKKLMTFTMKGIKFGANVLN